MHMKIIINNNRFYNIRSNRESICSLPPNCVYGKWLRFVCFPLKCIGMRLSILGSARLIGSDRDSLRATLRWGSQNAITFVLCWFNSRVCFPTYLLHIQIERSIPALESLYWRILPLRQLKWEIKIQISVERCIYFVFYSDPNAIIKEYTIHEHWVFKRFKRFWKQKLLLWTGKVIVENEENIRHMLSFTQFLIHHRTKYFRTKQVTLLFCSFAFAVHIAWCKNDQRLPLDWNESLFWTNA